MTYSYEVQSRKELPVNPEICRIRTDLSWEEVVANFGLEKKLRNGKKWRSERRVKRVKEEKGLSGNFFYLFYLFILFIYFIYLSYLFILLSRIYQD